MGNIYNEKDKIKDIEPQYFNLGGKKYLLNVSYRNKVKTEAAIEERELELEAEGKALDDFERAEIMVKYMIGEDAVNEVVFEDITVRGLQLLIMNLFGALNGMGGAKLEEKFRSELG